MPTRLSVHPTPAGPLLASSRPPPPPRRRWLIATATALVIMLAASAAARGQAPRPQLGAAASILADGGAPGEDRPITVAAADPLALLRLGQVGGTTLAMDSDGRYIYFGVGPRLVVANVDDPKAPRKIGQTEPLGGLIRDVVVSNRRAMVAVGAAGLAVVDIADPGRPTVVANLATPGYAWSVALSGHLYVADGSAGLRVIELDGDRPHEVGSLKLAADALRVAATAGYVYVVVDAPENYEAGYSWGLIQVVDVREPGRPRLVELDDAAFSPFSVVAVDGDHLLAAGGWDDLWLTVFDLTEPGNPTPRGKLEVKWPSGPVNDISVDGPRVALAQGTGHPIEGWVALVDVSDPAEPGLVARVNVSARGLQAVLLFGGQHLAAALPEGGLVTFDTTNPQRPVAAGALAVGFEALASAVSGDTAYLAASTAGLGVVDARVPNAPVLEGLYGGRGGGAITDYGYVALGPSAAPASAPRYAYVTSQHGDVVSTALRVFDLADPGGPREVAASNQYSTWYGALTLSDRHAFVVSDRRWGVGDHLLRVFDIATAITPTLAATMTLQAPGDIALRDGYAYVADAGYGLRVIDVRDPTSPRQTAGPSTRGSPVGVSVTDRYVLVADRIRSGANHGGLTVFDRTDPARPQLIGAVELPEWAQSVVAGDRWACVGFRGGGEWSKALQSDPGGVYLINLDEPTRPLVAQRLLLPGTASDVTAVGQTVYVSMSGGGLYILDVATYIRKPIYLPAVMAPGP